MAYPASRTCAPRVDRWLAGLGQGQGRTLRGADQRPHASHHRFFEAALCRFLCFEATGLPRF